MIPSDEELWERDPIEVYALSTDWRPSLTINGRPTEASLGARIFKLDDGTFFAWIEAHVADCLESFEDAELHLISQGMLHRDSDVRILDHMGPFMTIDEAKEAVAMWRPRS